MSNSTMTAGTAPEATSKVCAVPAPTVPPQIRDPQHMTPADARALTKNFLLRLDALEEGTQEFQYVRNTLIEMNLNLVRFVARRFSGRRDAIEDMLQVGTIGLIKAIDRYDIARGVEFTTLAVPYIQGEIKRFFRDTTWSVRVPRRLQELRIELARAREQLEGQGIHEPSVADLATHLDLDEAEVAEGVVAANCYDSESLDRPVQGASEQQTGFVADLMGTDDPALALAEDIQALKPHLAELGDRDRTILELRFGAEMTQTEIGNQLGLSQMHVSRLINRICTHLREKMLATG
ncbi:SigB/SigF/SigG family RNA polymerase sigma factor [Streptomyces lydicus]|uniref:SigB/SigF/SigG family RNA polymerase sigma factor n=1 Tax=Streptomyces lydicus TaxID=47763 RepID=UPI0037B705AC